MRREGSLVPDPAGSPPTWAKLGEAARVCVWPANRRRTLAIAGCVGSLLVAINQSGPLLGGPRPALLWVRVALDYLVPFAVSNLGVLAGTHCTDPGWTRAPGEAPDSSLPRNAMEEERGPKAEVPRAGEGEGRRR